MDSVDDGLKGFVDRRSNMWSVMTILLSAFLVDEVKNNINSKKVKKNIENFIYFKNQGNDFQWISEKYARKRIKHITNNMDFDCEIVS